MLYPQTFIDDLRRQADIVRIIQDYVALKRKGANWMACCPFHKEKTPSFSVNPGKEIFYCFGCHKGGSVFNFVMEIESVPFPEAVKIVAEKTGVPLPKLVDDSRYESRRQDADDVIRLNTWALEWWEQQLESGSGDARAAREYIAGREITEETRKIFRLGYAPDSWEALSLHLRQKGATQAQIESSGLVVKKEEGGSYDRFRGRLIFPVFNVQARPIAFGGRTLKEGEPAKYINSPETAVYVKGRNLFGLHLTRDEIRKQGFAILVEGFLDLMIPYQFGIRNVVASLGTALTLDQVKLLTRFARKVVVNYDGDRAGIQAAKRAIEILLTEDLDVKVLVLPDRADPDEFIRQFGATEYQRRRGEAQTHIQFVIDQAVADRNLHRPAEKAAAVEEVLPYVQAVRSRLQKREYFDMAMDALRVTDVSLRREFWQTVKTGTSISGDAAEKVMRRNVAKPTIAEQRLLELLLSDDERAHSILSMLVPEDYEDLPTVGIFRALVDINREGLKIDFDTLSCKTEGDTIASELIARLLMNDSWSWDSKETHAANQRLPPEECVFTFRRMKLDNQIEAVRSELATAERSGDEEEVGRLSIKQTQLTARRQSLLSRNEAAASGA